MTGAVSGLMSIYIHTFFDENVSDTTSCESLSPRILMIVTVQNYVRKTNLYTWTGRLINMTSTVSRLMSFFQHNIRVILIVNRVEDENY